MTKIGNYTNEELNSMVTLFKAVPVDAEADAPTASLEDCLLRGFIFISVHGTILTKVSLPLFIIAEDCYGIDKQINNQTFWKSFERVRDMDPREYVINQITHYFSTYGREIIGLKARPYVPVQDLDIPDNMLPFERITVIRFVFKENMIEFINHYALTTTAPSEQRIKQFTPLMKYLTIKTENIKSFELQVIKHDMDGTVPTDPQSFLRFLVYKTTGSTLLIKNRATRRNIQNAALNPEKCDIPYNLLSKANLAELATIFFRYRPIFLAFKAFDGCAPIINRIRRLADKYHVPMSDISVQNFMNLITQKRTDDIYTVIDKASNRELIKLLNFLNSVYWSALNRQQIPGVYNIRNGRTFVRSNTLNHAKADPHLIANTHAAVYGTLINRLQPILSGKKFYIPDYISYTVPISEKQFIGNIPWGTKLSTFNKDEAFTTGISWFNQDKTRVDIDLHLNSTTRHYGWNGNYTDGQDVIFTGDQTDAPEPKGAAEAYYFKPSDDTFILSANLYSGAPNTEFKMFMTSRKPIFQTASWWRSRSNYTFDPAEAMFAPIPLRFNNDNYDMTIGMFIDKQFFFYGGSVNGGIVPSANYEDFIKGLSVKIKSMLSLNNLLEVCDAEVLRDSDYVELDEEARKDVVDLSPEALTAITLLNLVDGNI